MHRTTKIGAITVVAALCLALAGASAHDESKYPDLKGQWANAGANPNSPWDPSKPAGRGQQPPLTAEYQAIWEAALARASAQDSSVIFGCLPPGMPRAMIAYEPIEIIVMPDTTYFMISYMSEFRRVFTDGHKWPADLEASYAGYSIGEWVDEDRDGKFDVLAIETRGLKGPRTFDGVIPMHQENNTVIKERLYVDKGNPNILHNEITVTDKALTRPWAVKRTYQRERNPTWIEHVCAEDNRVVAIGTENYKVSDDGYLMPTRRGQPAPDLRYFPTRR